MPTTPRQCAGRPGGGFRFNCPAGSFHGPCTTDWAPCERGAGTPSRSRRHRPGRTGDLRFCCHGAFLTRLSSIRSRSSLSSTSRLGIRGYAPPWIVLWWVVDTPLHRHQFRVHDPKRVCVHCISICGGGGLLTEIWCTSPVYEFTSTPADS